MLQRPAFLSGALRLVAVGLGGAAIAMMLQRGGAERLSEPMHATAESNTATEEVPLKEPLVAVAAPPSMGAWSLRTGGWYIRVDGAQVQIPSVAEQTAARPRASLGLSLSPFDHLIVHHANAEGFDWRLVAAVIFEESRFKPESRSGKGAYGLMQVRPIAAEAVGAEQFTAPEDNVKTGVRYLRRLDEMFHPAEGRDRLSLVLAAYNMGPGHVRDAQSLARRYGYDPNRWEDAMDLMLPLLEQPEIYEDLPSGYAKGRDTVAYVQRILERFHQYQRETASRPIPDVETDALSSSERLPSNG